MKVLAAAKLERVSLRGFEQKEDRKLSSMNIGNACAFERLALLHEGVLEATELAMELVD